MLDALSNAASSVTGAVAGAAKNALFLVAEKVIKEHTGRDIEVTSENVPSDWNEWMAKTGVNSLCSDWTWNFISNDRKKALFNERNITKIIMTVDESPDPDMKYETCHVTWETGSTTFKITWLPKAGDWESDNSWLESGYKRWWNIGDEIEFALQLYQLPGKCFYKSDWLENFEDVDPEGFLPTSTKKFARWFQFRHWVIFWYAEARWGWNYQWTETPPPLPDGSLFSLDAVLKLPSMPDLKMPNIKLPSLPNVSMPSLPSISAPSLPSISAPSLSMPSLSAPSLSMPSMPERKMRPKSKWDAHGIIELEDMKVKAKGSTLILSNCCITNFWERKDGGYDDEEKEHQRLELKCTNEEQAESWKLTLMASGVEEGEVGGCCTVA